MSIGSRWPSTSTCSACVASVFVEEVTVSIPLTFDWLTVAWLKTRFALWWRGRRSPRQLVLLWLLAVVGCVPVARFEETQSAAQVEQEGRRRSEQQVQALQAENA